MTSRRLRLEPRGPATSHVDGAWWPRSLDLTAELPDLAEDLAARLGRIDQVAYVVSMWDPAPRQCEVDGWRVRLEGFSFHAQNTIDVTGTNHGRLSLLVVAPVIPAVTTP